MSYTIHNIAIILKATATINNNTLIEQLLIDSRKITFPTASLFFALHSKVKNGHSFINEVYERGVRNFVIDEDIDSTPFTNANFLKVPNTLVALQALATHHRNEFNQLQVIGITGSNGKTIVKEWLNQLLQTDFNIVRSPRSYNSQIGVPLSVWQINSTNTLGIFEAGISTANEMDTLEKIIKPTIGILTNIGGAHNEGFEDDTHKFLEKIKLFKNASILIAREADFTNHYLKTINQFKPTLFTWGFSAKNEFVINSLIKQNISTTLSLQYKQQEMVFEIPFVDDANIENVINCICLMLVLKYSSIIIKEKILKLQPVEMRMQLKKAINNCYVVNDTYSNDLSSLKIALDYLQQQAGNQHTTVILSDILQSGINENELYQEVAALIKQKNIHKFIGIGEQLIKHKHFFENTIQQTIFYNTVDEFLIHSNLHQYKEEYILLKGARVFSFERIDEWFAYKVHQTALEINLNAIVHNLKTYQNLLQAGTKVMAMVKAFSYGSGSIEIARLLQYHKVDYLAVAYVDEGIELRKAGISLPIMVMNIDESGFNSVIENNLEPEIYSFPIYQAFHQYLQQQGITNFPIHLKLNTGMNRLGFDAFEVTAIATLLKQNNSMVVQSVFSHLTSSEDEKEDNFTLQQFQLFQQLCNNIQNNLGYSFIKHIANSAAAIRHEYLQMNMIRLGIGLYGVDSSASKKIKLQTVALLKTTIAQIRSLKKGDTVGYNRNEVLQRDSKIATIRIGYADGFSRKLGNRVGSVFIKGKLAKIVGNVCMDMSMVDVTEIENVKEDDVVEIFGNNLPVQQVATWCQTISYEILTTISQRVKRIYLEE